MYKISIVVVIELILKHPVCMYVSIYVSMYLCMYVCIRCGKVELGLV